LVPSLFATKVLLFFIGGKSLVEAFATVKGGPK
jgi:hypothetical protein